MHLPSRVWFDVVPLVVMFVAFALIERYARRHPYGTGRHGQMERKRRAREAHRQRVEQQDNQGKARNEAVMADMLARLQPEAGARTASRDEEIKRGRGSSAGGHPPSE
jgi:hypothetical protein